MMKRIGLWAFAGCGVAIGWAFFAAFWGRQFNFSHWIAFRLTLPISWFGQFRMTYVQAILLNAAAYTLVGLVTEPLWRRHR